MKIKVNGYSHEKFKTGDFYVYKYTSDENRHSFVQEQIIWLSRAQQLFPEYAFKHLYTMQKGSEFGYSMNRIDEKEMGCENANDLIKIVATIKDSVNLDNETITHSFVEYVNYLKDIVLSNPDIFSSFDWNKYESLLLKHTKFANDSYSYCHGDLTIDNILWDGEKYTLIDPNYKKNTWQSYLLDLSKLYQETRFDDSTLFIRLKEEMKERFNFTDDNMNLIDLLEISHYIRMIPYVIKYKDVFKEKLKRLNTLYTYYITNSKS